MSVEHQGEKSASELTNVSPISKEKQGTRGWKVELNGEEVPEVTSLRVIQHRMNITLEYGDTPAGFDGLALEEAGGGGSVTVPFLNVDGEIYVGVVEENRPNAGG